MTPPRKPGALTLATLSRLGGRVVCGLTLAWLVALVGWPERHRSGTLRGVASTDDVARRWVERHIGAAQGATYGIGHVQGSAHWTVSVQGTDRDSSPAVILGKLGR